VNTIPNTPQRRISICKIQVVPNGDLIATAVIVVMLLSYAYDAPTNPSAPSFRSPD